MENDIIKKIDDFIKVCQEEIRKEKRKNSNEKHRKEKQFQMKQQSEALKKYVSSGKRFGFNSCVEDCFGKGSIEAYKACRKRIKDSKKKATDEDFNKMEQLYREMQNRYKAPDSFYECPKLPLNTKLLSKPLMNLMSQISKHLDKQIQNSNNKD